MKTGGVEEVGEEEGTAQLLKIVFSPWPSAAASAGCTAAHQPIAETEGRGEGGAREKY